MDIHSSVEEFSVTLMSLTWSFLLLFERKHTFVHHVVFLQQPVYHWKPCRQTRSVTVLIFPHFCFLSKSFSNSCMEKGGYEEDFASVDTNLLLSVLQKISIPTFVAKKLPPVVSLVAVLV